jgi:hypothetical protein
MHFPRFTFDGAIRKSLFSKFRFKTFFKLFEKVIDECQRTRHKFEFRL